MARFDTLYKKVAHAYFLERKTQPEICQEYGISRRTLCRWVQKPEFTEYLKILEQEAIKEARRILLANVKGAANQLVTLLYKGKPTDEVKRKAAESILSRIEGLEKRLTQTQKVSGVMDLDVKDRILLDGLCDKDRQAIIEAYQGLASYLRRKIRGAKEKEDAPGQEPEGAE